ncbi:hypothetical protein [Arthrobacter sp. P2b]|uniref:hypothetical protein n=1 Tax=Arthrobacter sp. P2b TaxID=1938741 RepID=UPI0020CA2A65|nr:hypothetical protein [Arthrobacter sp. P2b]
MSFSSDVGGTGGVVVGGGLLGGGLGVGVLGEGVEGCGVSVFAGGVAAWPPAGLVGVPVTSKSHIKKAAPAISPTATGMEICFFAISKIALVAIPARTVAMTVRITTQMMLMPNYRGNPGILADFGMVRDRD